ncbi:MAG TPA: efflux RND transporter periplasmic adaptor subunit [Burkholderiaceae bacterium]
MLSTHPASAVLRATLAAFALLGGANAFAALELATVRSDAKAGTWAAEGSVEAVRRVDVAPQVSGRVVALPVKAGDMLKAGQLLARIDARAAQETAAAGMAQAEAARAALHVAQKEYERQRQLLEKQYISQAAFDRAEAQYKAALAGANAQLAAANAARTQSAFFELNAPFAGIVADVPASVGDMAMPGHPLLTFYDPAALRVSAHVPEAAAAALKAGTPVRVEFPGLQGAQRMQDIARWSLLPAADPASHTVELRIDLPEHFAGATPGAFARVWLPGAKSEQAHLYVPTQALFRRAEMTAAYVVDDKGRVQLRLVRAGHEAGGETEVLAGLAAGEHVALDPAAAARSQ